MNVTVDVLDDFSHKWVNSPVTKLLFISSLLSPYFDLGKFHSSLYTGSEEYECEKNCSSYDKLPFVKK